jgi:hypothetical protein
MNKFKNLKRATHFITLPVTDPKGGNYYAAYKSGKVRVWNSDDKEVGTRNVDKKNKKIISGNFVRAMGISVLSSISPVAPPAGIVNQRDKIIDKMQDILNKNTQQNTDTALMNKDNSHASKKNLNELYNALNRRSNALGQGHMTTPQPTNLKFPPAKRFFDGTSSLTIAPPNALGQEHMTDPQPLGYSRQSPLFANKEKETDILDDTERSGGNKLPHSQKDVFNDDAKEVTAAPLPIALSPSITEQQPLPDSEQTKVDDRTPLSKDSLKQIAKENMSDILKYKSEEAKSILNKVSNGTNLSAEERLFLDKWVSDISQGTRKEILGLESQDDLEDYREGEEEALEAYGNHIETDNKMNKKILADALKRVDTLSGDERSRQQALLGKMGEVGKDDFYKAAKKTFQKLAEQELEADQRHRKTLLAALDRQQRQEDFVTDKKIAYKGLFGSPADKAFQARRGELTPDKQLQLENLGSARMSRLGDLYNTVAGSDTAMHKENVSGQHKLSDVYGDIYAKQLTSGERATQDYGKNLTPQQALYKAKRDKEAAVLGAGRNSRNEQRDIFKDSRKEAQEDVTSIRDFQNHIDDEKTKLLQLDIAANQGDTVAQSQLIQNSNNIAQSFLGMLKQIDWRNVANKELALKAKELENQVQVALAQINKEKSASKASSFGKGLLGALSSFIAAGGHTNPLVSIPAAIATGTAGILSGKGVEAGDLDNVSGSFSKDRFVNWLNQMKDGS